VEHIIQKPLFAGHSNS